MAVMKFGGSSVGGAEQIRKVCGIIEDSQQPIVVVSAVSGVTDLLLESAYDAKNGKETAVEKIKEKHLNIIRELGLKEDLVKKELKELSVIVKGVELLGELTERTLDKITSFGEVLSSKIVAAFLEKDGYEVRAYTGGEAGIITDSCHTCANPLKTSYAEIREKLSGVEHIPVISGFIAEDENREITTLGRGGSDLTASIIGSALNTEEIQIWSDVDGIMTSDPRVCPGARQLEEVTFREAAELAYFGAKILHPRTLQPAMQSNIPVVVKNTFNPENKGTRIVSSKSGKEAVTGIAFKKNMTAFSIESARMLDAHGFLRKIFSIFDEYKTSVDVVTTSEVNVSLTLDDSSNSQEIKNKLNELGRTEYNTNYSVICVVGEGLAQNPSNIGRIISNVAEKGIPLSMVSQGASNINVTLVVHDYYVQEAVTSLHEEFVENG